ncbi:hypothetical protein HDU79_011300 [Rhizoclosmatium sp. JEL0117]|nr:hypothetical protein HDU79_011300 [Rhizoclosmatium sp. JEL0117]
MDPDVTPPDWMEAYYRLSFLEFTVQALEKEVDELKLRKQLREALRTPQKPIETAIISNGPQNQMNPAQPFLKQDAYETPKPKRALVHIVQGPDKPAPSHACLLFQESKCKWSNDSCSFMHTCLLCGNFGFHPLQDCVKFKACQWRHDYCFLWQRGKFLCHRKSCDKEHKCLRCDSEEHGAEKCLVSV